MIVINNWNIPIISHGCKVSILTCMHTQTSMKNKNKSPSQHTQTNPKIKEKKLHKPSHKSIERPPPNRRRHRHRRIHAQIPPKMRRNLLLRRPLRGRATVFSRSPVPLERADVRGQREREPPLWLVGRGFHNPLLRSTARPRLGLGRGGWRHVVWTVGRRWWSFHRCLKEGFSPSRVCGPGW